MPQNQGLKINELGNCVVRNGEMTTVPNNPQSPEVGQFPTLFFQLNRLDPTASPTF
jgi:hypothetical protein